MSRGPQGTTFVCLGMLACLIMSGCGRPAGVLFAPLDAPLRWPPGADDARIEYVGMLRSDRDLAPAKSGGEVLSEALFGTTPEQAMLSPYGVCTDGGDRLFVSDSGGQIVHVFDLERRRYDRWPVDETTPTFGQPLGLAWDAHGDRLLVADAVTGSIVTLNAAGQVRETLGAEHLVRPSGVAVDADGRIYVSDAGAHRVIVLDRSGALVGQIGDRGVAPGNFNFPTNVCVDDVGRVYVADSLNFRIQIFDENLEPLRTVGAQGDRPGYFSQPKGVALDSDGHLYVVDAHFETIQIFDDAGRLLLDFGGEGQDPGRFWLPAGIHIDSRDRIWVADSYNHRVQVFQYLEERP
ncbi:MAG: NHL repeat-containing protein [Planctomycetota bacterium]